MSQLTSGKRRGSGKRNRSEWFSYSSRPLSPVCEGSLFCSKEVALRGACSAAELPQHLFREHAARAELDPFVHQRS